MDQTTQRLMMGAAGASDEPTYVEDVFRTFLYNGNGNAGASQSINNGIDFAGEGGLIWSKNQGDEHELTDTVRGRTKRLRSDTNEAEGNMSSGSTTDLTSFNSNGFSLGEAGSSKINWPNTNICTWSFRRAKGFFDIVTYTGNGSSQNISHSLDATVGCYMIKQTSGSATNWYVWHRKLTNQYAGYLQLNTTNNEGNSSTIWNQVRPTTSTISVGNFAGTNANNETYVAYIFAEGTSDSEVFGEDADKSIIQCGFYSGNGSSSGPAVNIGWEPQYILIKNASSNSTNWAIFDSGRGGAGGVGNNRLFWANERDSQLSQNFFYYSSTGIQLTTSSSNANTSGDRYIYIAIRRPDTHVSKPVEYNTDLFNISAGNNSEWQCNFDPDFAWTKKPASTDSWRMCARHWEQKTWYTDYPASENNWINYNNAQFGYLSKKFGRSSFASTNRTAYMWRKSDMFDVVIYKGNSSTSHAVGHSLGSTPHMIWVKPFTNQGGGFYESGTMIYNYYTYQGATTWGSIGDSQFTSSAPHKFGNPAPNATNFYLGNGAETNQSGQYYCAMLWRNKTGFQHLGSYTGNGSATGPYLNCTFTPRVVVIKKWTKNDNYSYNQGWFVFDTVSGLTNTGNERPVELGRNYANTTFTSKNYLDLNVSGNYMQIKTDDVKVNYSGEKYLYFAVA